MQFVKTNEKQTELAGVNFTVFIGIQNGYSGYNSPQEAQTFRTSLEKIIDDANRDENNIAVIIEYENEGSRLDIVDGFIKHHKCKIFPLIGRSPCLSSSDWRRICTFLSSHRPSSFSVCGFGIENNVLENSISLHLAFPDTPVTVITQTCLGLSANAYNSAITVLKACGVNVTSEPSVDTEKESSFPYGKPFPDDLNELLKLKERVDALITNYPDSSGISSDNDENEITVSDEKAMDINESADDEPILVTVEHDSTFLAPDCSINSIKKPANLLICNEHHTEIADAVYKDNNFDAEQMLKEFRDGSRPDTVKDFGKSGSSVKINAPVPTGVEDKDINAVKKYVEQARLLGMAKGQILESLRIKGFRMSLMAKAVPEGL